MDFPLEYKATALGFVGDPRIPITLRTVAGDRREDFLIDTGADFSFAPRRLADLIGLDWETLPSVPVSGVGPRTVRTRLGSLPLRLQDRELAVRCLFLDSDMCPLVLGWADFLDRFVLTIDPLRRRITLEDAT